MFLVLFKYHGHPHNQAVFLCQLFRTFDRDLITHRLLLKIMSLLVFESIKS